MALAAPAGAASKCKAKVDKKTGVITVSAASAGNNPLWGGFAGGEASGFPDVGTCFVGGKLKSCHLGAPGTPQEVTPPPSCRVHIVDATAETCSALIPGCTVGLRPLVFSQESAGAGGAILNLTNVGEGATASLNGASASYTFYVGNSSGTAIRAGVGTESDGSAVAAYADGTRNAGEFEMTNDANPYAAVYARTTGTGSAIDAEVNSDTNADALYARTTSNQAGSYAGYFDGKVHVSGTLTKSSGSFRIDHPLDPERQYLSHSFVESPDMMNVYNGNVTLGPDGTAVVVFPDWFSALNRDFRYQLTPIGAPGVPYVAQEMAGNAFTIGGPPGLRVSWQVTGIRQDPWAEAHRIPVESEKPADEVGTYLHPEVYGQPRSRGLSELDHPILPPAPKPENEPGR